MTPLHRLDTPRRLLLSVAVLLGLLWAPLPAPAQLDKPPAVVVDLDGLDADRQMKAMRYPIRARISRYLSAAAEEIDEEKPDEAEALLLKLNPKRMNPYERALVYRMLAFIAYGSAQQDKAIGYFEQVLGEEVLPLRDESKIRFSVAQLHAGLEHWQEAITWVDNWARYERNPDPVGFYLKAIAQYQLGDFDGAIASTHEAIERAGTPRESWLRLLVALHSEKEDYEAAAPHLEELLLRFPKKQYWVQLSLIYGAREDYNRSLAVQQMAYEQGYLDEDKDLRRLVRSYLYRDLPYPAAKVLDEALERGTVDPDVDAYKMLANSWIAAREYDRSLPPLQKAAVLAEDGNIFIRLAQVHMQREEWGKAAEMVEKAIEKGDLKDRGKADILLGIAHYNDNSPRRARSFFVRARQYDSSRVEADRWIKHLETETGEG